MNSHPPYLSPGRPTAAENSYLGEMSSLSSPPERNLKYDSSENSLIPVEKNGFFLQRMKMLAANFEDRHSSQPVSTTKDEPIDGSGLNQTKPKQTSQT